MHRSAPISTVTLIPFHCSFAVGNITLTAYNYVIVIVSSYASPLNAAEATLAGCTPLHASSNLYLSILPVVFEGHHGIVLCALRSAMQRSLPSRRYSRYSISSVGSVRQRNSEDAFEIHAATSDSRAIRGSRQPDVCSP